MIRDNMENMLHSFKVMDGFVTQNSTGNIYTDGNKIFGYGIQLVQRIQDGLFLVNMEHLQSFQSTHRYTIIRSLGINNCFLIDFYLFNKANIKISSFIEFYGHAGVARDIWEGLFKLNGMNFLLGRAHRLYYLTELICDCDYLLAAKKSLIPKNLANKESFRYGTHFFNCVQKGKHAKKTYDSCLQKKYVIKTINDCGDIHSTRGDGIFVSGLLTHPFRESFRLSLAKHPRIYQAVEQNAIAHYATIA